MIEQALYHPQRRFGGRPDRVGTMGRFHAIVDLKTGAKEEWHRLQTALHSILVAAQPGSLPAEFWQRGALYLREDGSWKWDPHERLSDLTEARGILDDVLGIAA
jgi:hypothetical protein